MELARLSIVLSVEEARRAARALQSEADRIARSADEASRRWSTTSGTIARQLELPLSGMRNLEKQTYANGVAFNSLEKQTNGASRSLSGGGNSFSSSAESATKASAALTSSLQRMVATFLTLEAARRLVRAMIEATIDFERIRGVLSLVTSSAKEAAEQFRFLQKESDRIGIVFRDTADRFAKFEAAARDSGISVKQLKETFVTVAEAGRRFGLSSSDQARIFLALEQMVSKGVVSMEELRRQLGDALPGAFSIAARAMGMTTAEFNKLVESGRLLTVDFLGPFTRELAKMAPAGNTVASTAAEINRLKNAWDRFLSSQGIQVPVKFAAKLGTAALEDLATSDEQRIAQNAVRQREIARAVEQLRREGVLRDVSLDRNLATMGVPFDVQRRGVGQGGRVRNIWDEMWNDSLVRRFFDPATTVDDSALVNQRIRLNQLRDERAREIASRGPGGLTGALFDFGQSAFQNLQRQAAAPNLEQVEKFQKEANRLALEGLQGRERIVETWRQEEQRVKSLGLTLLQTEELRKKMVQARDAELKKFDEEQSRAAESKRAEEMTASYKQLQDVLRTARIEGMEPLEAAQARINDKFQKESEMLQEIQEQGFDTAEAYDAITKAKDKALREVRIPRNRAAFTGETVAQLRSGIRQDEQGLLTETEADKFQETTQRIQDRSAELTRRLKADATTVREAWSIGWEQQVKSFGSFQERVASAGAGLADSLETNFTDAFTAMITGTKSAADAFREMTASILSDLAQIAIRQFVVRTLLRGISSFGSAGASAAGTGAGAGSAAGSGLSGLQSTEATSPGLGFATELRSGFARISTVAAAQRPPQVTVINTFNMKDVDDHLAANPDAVVNSLSRRAGTVRRMIERS